MISAQPSAAAYAAYAFGWAHARGKKRQGGGGGGGGGPAEDLVRRLFLVGLWRESEGANARAP